MRKSELDQTGPCVNLRVSAGLQVKLTLSSNAILSIILIILEAEIFKLRWLTGLTAYVSPAWLTNFGGGLWLSTFHGGLQRLTMAASTVYNQDLQLVCNVVAACSRVADSRRARLQCIV